MYPLLLGRHRTLKDHVIADPYTYQQQAREINKILKIEFLDKGKFIEPLAPDPLRLSAFVFVCVALVVCFIRGPLLGNRNPSPSELSHVCMLSLAAGGLSAVVLLGWWYSAVPNKTATAVPEETKKDQ
jgi:hypothetical protein